MTTDVAGYLPNDTPGIGRLILLGLQHAQGQVLQRVESGTVTTDQEAAPLPRRC